MHKQTEISKTMTGTMNFYGQNTNTPYKLSKMRTPDEELKEQLKRPEFKKWYDGRPASIKLLVAIYPYDIYRIKPGSPYAITSPGTIVELESYRVSGEVVVMITPENLTESAKEHIEKLCAQYEKDFHHAITSNHFVPIDPTYLEPYEPNQI